MKTSQNEQDRALERRPHQQFLDVKEAALLTQPVQLHATRTFKIERHSNKTLKSFEFDKFLEAIHHKESPLIVEISNITSVQPTSTVKASRSCR